MKLKWHGHSVVSIETDGGVKLLIDPFITGHEACDLDVESLEVDYILLTHAHSDHVGDTQAIAERTGALIISNVEIVSYFEGLGLKGHGMQPGGAHEFDFGLVKMFPAIHGSSLEIDGKPFTLGLAMGIMLTIDGKTIYHLGDTALYSDMQLIGQRHDIDLAFVPIGDNFTMGIEDALLASEWLEAKTIVPIHYNTFPVIEQDPEVFVAGLKKQKGLIPKIGERIPLD